ncbi:MAG: hypothetical protein AAFN77_20840 [Planctomycetota bacterium]
MAKTSLQRNGANVVNVDPRFYMNVGSWGDNGKTDIALICGNLLVLASWLPKTPSQQQFANPKQQADIESNAKLKSFFQDSAAKGRGFVMSHEIVRSKKDVFSNESDLIIVVGDCHINLLKEWGPDNFIRMPNKTEFQQQRTRISMWEPFEEFVNFASGQTSKDNLVHVGDLYDYWEAQNIFEHAAYVLYKLMLKFTPPYIFNAPIIMRETPLAIRKEMPPSLLSDPMRYTEVSQKPFKWLEYRSGPEFSNERLTTLYLARYFGIPDPASFGPPKTTTTKHPSLVFQTELTYLNVDDPHIAEHIRWCNLAHQKFYEYRPTLRDALALIFFGLSEGWHGMSNHTTPVEFDKTISWWRFETGWSVETIQHFSEQCGNLQRVDERCDFLDCEKIKSLIQHQYNPATFNKLKCVFGNHDISDADQDGKYKNKYLERVYRDGIPFDEAYKELDARDDASGRMNRLDENCDLSDPYLTHRRGKDDCVVIEHGHVWDVYNNPNNYSLFVVNVAAPAGLKRLEMPDNQFKVGEDLAFLTSSLDGGFHACRGWTVGQNHIASPLYDGDMNDPTYYRRGTYQKDNGQGEEVEYLEGTYVVSESGKRLVSPQADHELALACETRMNAIFEAKHDEVRLVVMGHTHMPFIIRWDQWQNQRADRAPIGTTFEGIGDAAEGSKFIPDAVQPN